ncbi:hypothetical protein [Neorhizobium galegae]|uniref:hypothetical protein n=1 Tax=Neorhizobium galegae TaxID=399 RepID=UPI001353F63F|nr:hypothetical protein [Neorhizobium galegae]KAB1109418.1 hypothetical protein F4V89_27155 [Neorhizobium galegae]MCM2501564.1 hypothetical protein [Neorhizobium galegae]MCQ1772514.1 hypothetical protein [Neorhizobium galegae]MCQ1799920.1 hypothetical protein [Neorhizobium galegae]
MAMQGKIVWVMTAVLTASPPALAQTEPIRSAEQHISCSAFYSMRKIMAKEFGKSDAAEGSVSRDEEHMHAALVILQDNHYPRDKATALFERQTQQMLEKTQSMAEADFAALDRSCRSLLEQSRQ